MLFYLLEIKVNTKKVITRDLWTKRWFRIFYRFEASERNSTPKFNIFFHAGVIYGDLIKDKIRLNHN
jgi:hypothetical protein